MNILGIESSSLVASVAIVTDQVVTAEYTVNFKKTHSQTLLPMLDEVVKMTGFDLETIDAMAYNLYGCASIVCPIMDARRDQVYTGIYENKNGFSIRKESCAMDIRDLIQELNELGEAVIFLGDGVPVYKKQIEEAMTVPFSFAPAHVSRQRGASVAALGSLYFEEGNIVTAAEHAPDYLRKPQAEREREEQEAKGNVLNS